MYHRPHLGHLPQQPGTSFQELQATYFPQQPQQQFVVDDKPPQPSWGGNSPTAAGGQLMLQADARATFSSIANWAHEVCVLSEKVEKTGLMSALDYRRLQFLGYTILQHVGLAGAAASATQTTPTAALLATTPLVEVPVKKEKKRKDRSSSSSVKSSTRCSDAATSPKKRRKHDSTTESVTLVAEEQQACVAQQPEGTTPVKTCAECGNWKTHQWRSGPQGMSTLCNACGMRYSRRQKKEAGGEVVATPTPVVVVVPVAKGGRQSSKKIRRPRSPQCGHESDHSLSPVSSPLPGTPQLQQLPSFLKQQLQQQPFDPRSCSVLAAPASPAATHEKRSNLYTLLN